jgi:hypothetical protein
MSELFDTSALILAARHTGAAYGLRESIEAGGLAVTDIVVTGYLNGARNLAEYDRFAWSLGAAERLQADSADWDRGLHAGRAFTASAASPGA